MFVPLRLHSVYSRGKGSATLEEAAAWVSRKRLPVAAIADIENLYGWAKWKRAAEARSIRPLFGCELEIAGRRFIFLAKCREGYWNLMEIFNWKERKLVEEIERPCDKKEREREDGEGTELEGMAKEWGEEREAEPKKNATVDVRVIKRRVDSLGLGAVGRKRQKEEGEGMIRLATDGLVVIFIPQREDISLPGIFRAGLDLDPGGNREPGILHLASAGSTGTYPSPEIEFLPGGDFYLGGDFSNFRKVEEWARACNLPVVWANPLKFITSPDRLILVRAIVEKIPFPSERQRLADKTPLFGPDQEAVALKRLGSAVKGAFERTFEVAEKCLFNFEDIVPPLPPDLFPTPLGEVVMERLREARNLSWRERERARHELEVIERSGFAAYFLIVHDVVEFARRHRILHNLKGSGASSYLAYLLGISHVNPVEFDLYFERFLNSGRNDPPDIDLDFDSRRRDEVLAYVLKKYGQGEKAGGAFVCSLKNYRARSALYETARAFGIPPEEARSLAKRIPFFAEPDFLRRDKPAAGQLDIWKLASELSGVFAEISLHVGGVILTPAPASRYLPLEESAKGFVMSHFDRDAVEDLKLIKLDLLSVRGLAAISETRERLNVRTIPAGDARTYKLLQTAQTIGCFQVESPAMMNLLRRMKPETIYDLTQALALIRPGPTESGMKETLLRAREKRQSFRDPLLEKIIPETDGLLLYEEQVMQVAERVAGMPAEEGDLLRRALKKKNGVRAALKEKFFGEARERGYTAVEVEKLWATMEKFSSYSFNKAHSASYAAMAYQAVYLKAHHPVRYMAAVLNAGGGYYPLPEYIEEAKRRGIHILGPDINRSGYGFEVEGSNIRVGLASIKGLAVKTIEKILEERKDAEFASVEDFLSRVHLGRAELLSLIKAGVFDSLEPRRTRQVLRHFQGLEDMEEVADMNPLEKAKMLVDSLGFSPGPDSLELYEGKRPELRVRDLAAHIGRQVELVVRVVDARLKETNSGRKYFYLFEDETGLLEGVGEKRCLSFGSPPLCCLRGEVRRDRSGAVKIHNCSFLREF
ncbi:MAG: DNA polymerase III subunit alpha [Clostridiales bacterium]|nr:DNA polymerase III subunit alpha [Clostridiales bacterium]